MTAFRKWFVALAVLVLMVGAAYGQVINCQSAATQTRVRAEGLTEQVSDVVMLCSTTATLTGPVSANIQIFTTKDISSRITHTSGGQTFTEALIAVDEPPPGSQNLWPGTTSTPNVWQGVRMQSNSLMFFNIPIVTPTATTRTIRITNVRVAVNEDPSLVPAFPNKVSMLLTVSTVGTPFTIIGGYSTLEVAAIMKGMDFSLVKCTDATSATSLSYSQCSSVGKTDPASTEHAVQIAALYKEGIDSAFRIKEAVGQDGAILGAMVGASEGGYINRARFGQTGLGNIAEQGNIGVATNGTRLLLRFKNIPTGVIIYVSTRPIASTSFTSATIGPLGAGLVSVTDTTGTAGSTTFYVPGTGTTLSTARCAGDTGSGADANLVVPVQLIAGAGAATWEIVQASNTAVEQVAFAIGVAYSAKPDQNLPAITDGTPGQAAGLLAPAIGPAGMSGTAPVARFADFERVKTLVDISQCASILLFPFVTTDAGFDTGIAISNTTMDNSAVFAAGLPNAKSKRPFNTTPQNSGSCTMYLVGEKSDGTSLSEPVMISGVVNAGKQLIWSMWGGGGKNTGSLKAVPMFTGYMFAVCNFELAHGFAYISGLGLRPEAAMGYLSLVISAKGLGDSRSGVREALDQ